MMPTRSLRRIPPLLSLVMVSVLASPASARRGPTASPVTSPDDQLQAQLTRAASMGANDLRSCDRFLSRATSPLLQVRLVGRSQNGRVAIDASLNPGGSQYTSCLEAVMGNAVLQAAQSMGQPIPTNGNAVTVDVPLPITGQVAAPQPSPPVVGPTPQPPNYVSPPPAPQVAVSPMFQESGRFAVRNVRLAGQGSSITVANGGVIEGTMEIEHRCAGCGGAINQVIVGLGGEAQAQQCVWNGGANSRGFETVRFQLNIPNRPGTYEVRVRYAQALSCRQGALGWWRVDRPNGPDARSNIGVVVVQPTPGVLPPAPVVLPTEPVVRPLPVQPAQQPTNLLVNGGFEQLRLAAGSWQLITTLTGWQLAAGPGVELQHNVVARAAEGSQFVELDGSSSSAIFQDVRTVPGQLYMLRLAFSARPGTSRADNAVAIQVSDQIVASIDADGSQLTDAHWTYHTVYFLATARATRIELRDIGQSNGLGSLVDDVSLTTVAPGRAGGR